MSNLSKPTQLSAAVQIMQAMNAPALRDLEPSERFQAIKEAYFKAIFARGAKVPQPDDLKIELAIFNEQLMKRRSSITAEELKIALTNGAMGDYGEVYGITPKAAMDWVEGYYQSTVREQARRSREEAQKALPKPREVSREYAIEFWEREKKVYQKRGYSHGSEVLFKIMKRLNKVDTFDKNFQEAAYARARKIVQRRKAEAGGVKALREILSRFQDEESPGFKCLVREGAVYNQFDKELNNNNGRGN